MHRFRFYPTRSTQPPELRGAHLIGADGVPVRGEVKLEGGMIVCESRSTEALGLSLIWPIKDFGAVQIETTRLLARPEPYHLHVELARQRLMRVSMKREEWGLFDYPGMEDIAAQFDAARDRFVEALQTTDNPEKAAALADESLALSVRGAEDMCRFHARVFLSRRQSSGGFARGGFLGANVPAAVPKLLPKIKWTDAFDFVRLPFTWREIQPKENTTTYDSIDIAIKTYSKAGLSIRGGPVLTFGVQSIPDWLYIWENDYEAIVDFAREHIRRTVARYAGVIQHWNVATGIHADGVFSFSFEQIMDLTRMAMTTAKQAGPKSQVVLDLTQPWGEYYARNQRTVPPMLYAEMAVQSGIPFDAFGLQFVYGVDSEGFHLRDTLQISSLIDRLANLGKPIHITAMGVPSSGNAGGAIGSAWSEASQAEWLINFAETALSKPYVESVCVQCVTDDGNLAIPGCGVAREDGTAKPAYAQLAAMRSALLRDGRK